RSPRAWSWRPPGRWRRWSPRRTPPGTAPHRSGCCRRCGTSGSCRPWPRRWPARPRQQAAPRRPAKRSRDRRIPEGGDHVADAARTVTMRGNPRTLVGDEVKVGDQAPDFEVVNNDLQPVTLADYRGKVKVLLSVPSLDTGVCDQETRRFNEEAAGLGDDVVVLAISTDLPFAQKRWCAAAGVERVETLSDHRETSFGRAYGVLMDELRLLARAVFVV